MQISKETYDRYCAVVDAGTKTAAVKNDRQKQWSEAKKWAAAALKAINEKDDWRVSFPKFLRELFSKTADGNNTPPANANPNVRDFGELKPYKPTWGDWFRRQAKQQLPKVNRELGFAGDIAQTGLNAVKDTAAVFDVPGWYRAYGRAVGAPGYESQYDARGNRITTNDKWYERPLSALSAAVSSVTNYTAPRITSENPLLRPNNLSEQEASQRREAMDNAATGAMLGVSGYGAAIQSPRVFRIAKDFIKGLKSPQTAPNLTQYLWNRIAKGQAQQYGVYGPTGHINPPKATLDKEIAEDMPNGISDFFRVPSKPNGQSKSEFAGELVKKSLSNYGLNYSKPMGIDNPTIANIVNTGTLAAAGARYADMVDTGSPIPTLSIDDWLKAKSGRNKVNKKQREIESQKRRNTTNELLSNPNEVLDVDELNRILHGQKR